jgi:hypothetical protein
MPGELMHRVAEGLAREGLSVSYPEWRDARRLMITCPAARCTLAVEDCGQVTWEWHPASAGGTDPKQLADIASTLLTGQGGPYPRRDNGYERPELTLKGVVGRELAARGMAVDLEVYLDEVVFDAQAGIVITAPGGGEAEVRVTDNGCLSWERDYWPEAVGITWEPSCTSQIADPQGLADVIVTAVTQAMVVAVPGPAGTR